MTVPGEPPQLDYAPRPPLLRRFRVYRWLIAVTIIATIYFGRNCPYEVWHHFQLLALEGQCIKHQIPGGTVVYSSDDPAAAIVSPDVAALYAATQKDPFSAMSNPYASGSESTVFAGELCRADGTREFVTIEGYAFFYVKSGEGEWDLQLVTQEFDPKLIRRDGLQRGRGGGFPSRQNRPDILLYSATRDANDPSLIHLRYCIFDKEYDVDGHLDKDGPFRLGTETSRPR